VCAGPLDGHDAVTVTDAGGTVFRCLPDGGDWIDLPDPDRYPH